MIYMISRSLVGYMPDDKVYFHAQSTEEALEALEAYILDLEDAGYVIPDKIDVTEHRVSLNGAVHIVALEDVSEIVFQEAIEVFPYDMEPTGYTMGDFDTEDYQEEYTCTVCKAFGHTIMAGGWFELREGQISCILGFSLDGNWKGGHFKSVMVSGYYDIDNMKWKFELGAV